MIDNLIRKSAKFMAYLGGAVLLILIFVTSVSILGRILNTIGHNAFIEQSLAPLSALFIKFGPINGDFEIVEAGVAFAIMCFLPLCQLNRGHASVELFTAFFPRSVNAFLAFLWEAVFAFVLIIIAWRLYVGTGDKMRYGETTFMLQYPLWWGYAACAFAATIACIAAIYSVYLHGKDALQKKSDQAGASQ